MSKWPMVPLREVLQLQRRWIKLEPLKSYREIGIRSFGKGIFHKTPVDGSTLGSKRVLRIEPGDIVFNNVFAWEGAVAVAGPDEVGMIGSHRFVTYTVNPRLATSEFLKLFFTTEKGLEILLKASPGSAGRNKTLGLDRFISHRVPLPPLTEQQTFIEWIEAVATRVEEADAEADAALNRLDLLLMSAFQNISTGAPMRPMGDIAPLTRRPVEIVPREAYPELGVRCFGKGTFHKTPLSGAEVGTKKLYSIQPGDIVFSNVFAWEGAIAVATAEDAGRFGSHRFITCVPNSRIATPRFVCYYFQQQEGLEKIRKASPGGAGRNRTLGLAKLEKLLLPVPKYEQQLWFDQLFEKVAKAKQVIEQARVERAALLPSVLNRVFNERD